MKSLLHTMVVGLAAMFIAVSSPLPTAQAQAEEAPVSSKMVLEGDWRGPDGNGHVTFRFQYENGSWLGFFVSERDGKLYPVEELQVSGRSVSFRNKSTPEIIFALTVEDDNRTLMGTGTLPNGMAIPYSLTRKEAG